MSLFKRLKQGAAEHSKRPATRNEKAFFAAAAGAVVVVWLTGAIAWYWCLLACVFLLSVFVTPTPKGPIANSASSPTAGVPAHFVGTPNIYRFKYQGSKGDARERRVRLQGRAQNGHTKYLVGTCLEANAERTFRLDRIISNMTDDDTGELLTPEDIYAACKTTCNVQLEPESFSHPAQRPQKEWVTAVYLAGFRGSKYGELESLAIDAGWHVRANISPSVDYLVANGHAGKKQLAQAAAMGVTVIDEEAFRTLTGGA